MVAGSSASVDAIGTRATKHRGAAVLGELALWLLQGIQGTAGRRCVGCGAGGGEARDRPSYGNSKLPQQGNGAAHVPHQSAPDLQNDFPSLG